MIWSQMQISLFEQTDSPSPKASAGQLLKWIGNKQRFARDIVTCFPHRFGTYYEPFLGSGAVLGRLGPDRAVASDIFRPLMEIWNTLRTDPQLLKKWYADRWSACLQGNKIREYERIKASYNAKPNGADLLFLCRACYGGVVRFRQSDGHMSTPCGIHQPISPAAFSARVDSWRCKVAGAEFRCQRYQDALREARSGDLIYCDPPYSHTQSILYGAQHFELTELLDEIRSCKQRGVRVALSIDGTKRSGKKACDLPIPPGLFEREMFVQCGRSMLKRFQMNGRSLESEHVSDRLLLTY